MLLWFNLISENKKVSMGSSIETDTKPEFEVKAMGSSTLSSPNAMYASSGHPGF